MVGFLTVLALNDLATCLGYKPASNLRQLQKAPAAQSPYVQN